MRLSRSVAALCALPTVLAVTLSDFTPRVSSLPSSCNIVYTQTISGCQPSDFQNTCSKACVLALNSLTTQVQSACGNEGITGSNIIVQFLNGNGPGSLCDNAASYLTSSTSATQAATSSSSSTRSTSSSATSTTAATSSTTSAASTTTLAVSTATVTASSSTAASSSSAILVDSSTQSATSSAHRSSQTNTADSGGGSPFDAEGNTVSGGAALSSSSVAAALLATILALAFALR